MTREEAIAAIKAKCHYCKCFSECVHDRPECFSASEMAIRSLEAWDAVENEYKDFRETHNSLTDFGEGYRSALAWATRLLKRKVEE